MWTEDLHWAWKLRDQKRQQEREKINSATSQESQELLEFYAADLENDLCKDELATVLKHSKEEPMGEVT